MFQIGNVSNLAYLTFLPNLCSWYNWERQVANLPLPPPGAVITTKGLVTSIYGFAPYPSSLTIVSTSVGYPFVKKCLYTLIPLRSNLLINISTAGDSSYLVTTHCLLRDCIF